MKVVEKKIADLRIVVSGVGAAGNAIIQLLMARGAKNIIACGRAGAINRSESYADAHRSWLAQHTNPENFTGSLKEAMVGAGMSSSAFRHRMCSMRTTLPP